MEKKKNIFLILYILFLIFTIIGAIYSISSDKNAGYAVIPMIFGLVFSVLYRNAKKSIDENK